MGPFGLHLSLEPSKTKTRNSTFQTQKKNCKNWKHLYRRFQLRRYQKLEFLLPVTVSVTFQAKEVAFKCHHTSDACLQPCFYMTSAQFGSLQSLSVSPGALNVEIDGM